MLSWSIRKKTRLNPWCNNHSNNNSNHADVDEAEEGDRGNDDDDRQRSNDLLCVRAGFRLCLSRVLRLLFSPAFVLIYLES